MLSHKHIILIFLLISGCIDNNRCKMKIDIGETKEGKVKTDISEEKERKEKTNIGQVKEDKIPIDINEVIKVLSEHINRNKRIITFCVIRPDKVFSFSKPMKVDNTSWSLGWWLVTVKEDTIHAFYRDAIFVKTPIPVDVGEVDVYMTYENGKYEILDWNVQVVKMIIK